MTLTPGRRLAAFAVCVLSAWGTPVSAQMEGCEFGERGRNMGVRTADFGGTWYIGGPHFVCDDGAEIFADSVVVYEDRGRNDLIGSVRYYSGDRQLFADQARYFTREGRFQASGSLRVIDLAQGSTIENGDLVLLLTTSTREREEMTVTTGADGIRPRAVMLPTEDAPVEETDQGGNNNPGDSIPTTPYTVVSDRLVMDGGGGFVAVGDVEVERDSLFAWADSLTFVEGEGGGLNLDGEARVESETYELAGEQITMGAPGAAQSTVVARRRARLDGDDIELTSALITMFLVDDQLERLVATPNPVQDAEPDSLDLERPWAAVETFELTGDSLDVLAPLQRLERVLASGNARSESSAGDSLNVELLPEVARKDWLEGDTIVITFEPEDDDTGEGEMTVQQVVATVGARSLYRLPSNDSTAVAGTDPPAVHYVTGDQITIRMDGGEISDMEVAGQTRGVHLEPLARRPAVVPDSARTNASVDTVAAPDSSGARIDTLAVVPEADAAPSTPPDSPHDGERRHPEDRPWNRP